MPCILFQELPLLFPTFLQIESFFRHLPDDRLSWYILFEGIFHVFFHVVFVRFWGFFFVFYSILIVFDRNFEAQQGRKHAKSWQNIAFFAAGKFLLLVMSDSGIRKIVHNHVWPHDVSVYLCKVKFFAGSPVSEIAWYLPMVHVFHLFSVFWFANSKGTLSNSRKGQL